MTNPEEHSYDEVLVLKVLAKEANAEEEQIFHEKCNTDATFQKMYFEMKEMWESSQALAMVQDVDIDKAIENFMTRVDDVAKKNKRAHHLFAWMTGIAATIAIGLIVNRIFFRNNQLEIMTSNNTATIVLPDSSQIIINKNSRFVYPKYFKGNNREVFLSGEAYFKVKKNIAHPFVINMDKACIRVLGTSFNVNGTNQSVVVSVNSGNVLLFTKNKENKQIELKKGETGCLSLKDQTLSKLSDPDANYNAWATGIVTFNQTSLYDAVKVLGQYYHTKITFQNKNLGNCKLTAIFDHQSLNSVLEILKLTFEIKSLKQDSIVLIGNGCVKN